MNLYVLRHASAGTRRLNPVVDVKRPLDKEGKQQCMLIGSYLSALDVHFDLVVSSPLKRALQTASLVGTEVGYDQKIKISPALAPEASLTEFQTMVSELNGSENVLIVGHNPNLPQFLGSLISIPGRAAIRVRKGAIARIDCTRRPGTLHWLVDPRILRGVYGNATKDVRRRVAGKGKAASRSKPAGKPDGKSKF